MSASSVPEHVTPRGDSDRPEVALIAVAALLSLVLVLHHPVLHTASGITVEKLSEGVLRLAPMSQFVHGALMIALTAQSVGLARFSRRLGFAHSSVLGAYLLFLFSVLMLFLAAAFDGFITPAFATICGGESACGGGALSGFALISAAIQAFTKIGLASQGLAFLLWAVALLRRGKKLVWFGAAGIALSGFCLFQLITAVHSIEPQSLAFMLLFLDTCALGAALLLFLGWLSPRSSPAPELIGE